jgi:hypothetical protein
MPGITPVVSDVLRVRYVSFSVDQVAINTLHYYVLAVTGTGATLQEIASGFMADVNVAYKGTQTPNSTFRGTGARNMTPPRTLEFTSIAGTGVGTVAANELPRQVTALFNFRTFLAGKKERGRIYLPFVPATFADGAGNGTAAATTAYTALLTAMLINRVIVGAGGNTTLTQVIRHADGTTSAVQTHTYTGRFATQRRRGNYGRLNIVPLGF